MIRQSPAVVAWLGPVNLQQVQNASIPGASKIVNITCTGDGSPSCADIAAGWTGPDGRVLPGLLASKGLDPGSSIAIGAFSAGGSIAKRALMAQADRDQTRAVALADATYTTTEGAPEGFVRYAVEAADPNSNKLFVATASSSPNKNWPTGAQTLDMIRAEVEKRRGQRFDMGQLPGVTPQPARVWRLGNVLFADYQNILPHGSHATVLAPQIWKNVIAPWFAGGDPGLSPLPGGPGSTQVGPSASESIWINVAAFAAASLVGYAGLRWALKRI